MQPLPHHYEVLATAAAVGEVTLDSANVEAIVSEPPAEFGGSGQHWSPESLLVAAIADCFILSFRGTARASKFEWTDLRCSVTGTLDRVDKVTKFTHYKIQATLTISADSDPERGERLLHKAEASCLITNSLTGEIALETTVKQV